MFRHSVLNVKTLVATLNLEKVLVWGLLRDCDNFADGSFEALHRGDRGRGSQRGDGGGGQG